MNLIERWAQSMGLEKPDNPHRYAVTFDQVRVHLFQIHSAQPAIEARICDLPSQPSARERLIERALQANRERLGADELELSMDWNNLGLLQKDRGQLAEAERNGEGRMPDLVLIDGGKGQLNAVIETFIALDIKPPFTISLAKQQEEVFVPGESESRKLSRHSFALRLLQYVRDEAHRFAQAYHHLLRRKSTFE